MTIRRFAQVDKNNKVFQVVVAENIAWCQKNYEGVWVETFESNLASIDDVYDEKENKFLNTAANYDVMTLEEYNALFNIELE